MQDQTVFSDYDVEMYGEIVGNTLYIHGSKYKILSAENDRIFCVKEDSLDA